MSGCIEGLSQTQTRKKKPGKSRARCEAAGIIRLQHLVFGVAKGGADEDLLQ